MRCAVRYPVSLLTSILLMLAVVALGSPVAGADGPPGPAPYPKIFVTGTDAPGPGYLTCWDADGSPLYDGQAWSLEPLVRGPLFAPVVLWLADAGNQPVVPLEFHSWVDLTWRTVDSGPPLGSEYPVGPVGGRPVGFGSTPTDPSPRVTCTSFDPQGYWDFGDYLMTRGLVKTMSLPKTLIGRKVNFDNEGTVTFTVKRNQFPLTASRVVPTLATADQPEYGTVPVSRSSIRCMQGSPVRYTGPATTFAPLVRGFGWAPMAMWLTGDRIVTPRWFTSRIRGSWRTVSGSPVLRGRLAANQEGSPSGYGTRPGGLGSDIQCTGSGPIRESVAVTPALAQQLSLPSAAVGRKVRLSGAATTRSYVAPWLFPPAQQQQLWP